MSLHMAKAAMRQAKNVAKGYTDVQAKVREATSNDPWIASSTLQREIADATFNPHEFQEIMEIVDKRLNDSGKNWRHVFKALTLLDYMIHSGSEQVIAYAKQNLYVIKTLKEFQHIDEEGRDQGLNVREKSKALAALLADEERLKEERKTRAALRERMGGPVSPTYSTGPSSSGTPRTQSEEQRQLERALEESRATAAEHERKQKAREKEERELQRAIEETKREHQQKQVQAVDLWGAAPEADQRKQDLDFFSSMATTAPVQQSQPDPFGFGSFGQSGSGAGAVVAANPFGAPQHTGPAAFGGAATSGMFQQQSSFASFQQPTQQTQQGNMFGGNPQFAASTPSFAQPAQQQQLSARMLPPSGGFGGQASSSTAATPSFNFDSAFDTGAGQKSFVPRHLQGQANPAAQIAQIARNSSQIDPFASMANRPGSGSTAAPLAPSNTSGWSTAVVAGPQASAAANPFGGKSTAGAADPFASLAPLSKPPSAAQNQPQQPKTLAGMGGASTASFGGGNYGIASVQAQPLQSQQSFQTGAQNPFGGAATGAMFGAPATQQQKSPFGQAQQQPQQQQQPAASQQQNFFF